MEYGLCDYILDGGVRDGGFFLEGIVGAAVFDGGEEALG